MSRRALRAGDHIWVEAPAGLGTRRIDTQLVARDDRQYLVLCHAPDLEGVDVGPDAVVSASWHRNGRREETQVQVSHIATYPVGTLVLNEVTPANGTDAGENTREAPRLHRVLPAQVWTPETGHLAAVIVDISTGGARLRLRERPPALECDVVLGCGDEPVELRATVLEIIPPGVAGRQHEVRLQFLGAGEEAAAHIDSAVRRGVSDAIAELGFDARAASP